jgi:hypothetical protein
MLVVWFLIGQNSFLLACLIKFKKIDSFLLSYSFLFGIFGLVSLLVLFSTIISFKTERQ